ncbi:MAG: AMP-binding protein, partial [Tannerella sp.]|nr:AMP-binding protein [Tannerella sp.]
VNIREIKPHLILSVPALAKNFKKNIEQGIQAQGKFIVRLFHFALRVGYCYNGEGSHEEGRGWRILLKPLVGLFNRMLFSKIRGNFGGELKFFISGGALLDKDLQKFYYALGMPMYQGYGLSEATPVISTNGPRRHCFGSSGMLVKPLELRICDAEGCLLPDGEKGEIVVQGENVAAGYWKNPVSTGETIRNGWLHTGDMGYMEDGLLYVMGRFKSLLIANDGEKYSPEGIEEAMLEYSSCIDQLLLYNNQSPYTVALLVPNRERLKAKLSQQHLDLKTEKGKIEAIHIIRRQLDRFRKGGDLDTLFPNRWLPASFAILPEPWTEQNGMINSTMKVVRRKVEKHYMHRIEHLFTVNGKNPVNAENIRSL